MKPKDNAAPLERRVRPLAIGQMCWLRCLTLQKGIKVTIVQRISDDTYIVKLLHFSSTHDNQIICTPSKGMPPDQPAYRQDLIEA